MRDSTITAIAYQRLLNQRLSELKGATPGEVTRWMGALQAQDYSQVLWGIGLRTAVPTLMEVEQAMASGAIVLTWPMRGTIHAVPAEDAHWMLKLLTPRLLLADARRQKQLELTEVIIERARTVFHESLQGNRLLTRDELMQLLEQAGINPKGQRGYHLLWYLAQEGLICFGPRRGRKQTFVLLDEWVSKPRLLSPEAALEELARRYFTSHGPATLLDFAGWTGLPMALARQGLEAVKSTLVSEKEGDRIYWQLPTTPRAIMPTNSQQVLLLPGFDEYLLGYKDRRDVLAAEHANQVVPGGNGVFKPLLVADGQVVGTWKRTLKKGTLEIAVTCFKAGQISDQLIIGAGRQYCQFLGLPQGKVSIT